VRQHIISCILSFFITAIVCDPLLADLRAYSTNPEDVAKEWNVYRNQPELMNNTFQTLSRNVQSFISLLDDQNIHEGRRELEKILIAVPTGVSSDPEKDFQNLLQLREQFKSVIVGAGLSDKLIADKVISSEVMGETLHSISPEVLNHAEYCAVGLKKITGVKSWIRRHSDSLTTAGGIGLFASLLAFYIYECIQVNWNCAPD
jgi:hypothetical protein